MTEPLYRKIGRKYVPAHAEWDADRDSLKTGTFRLTYAYQDGARRYEYEVTPATAPAVAAMMIARQAIEEAIQEASQSKPMGPHKPYTKKQLEAIKRFKEEMGGMYPQWWTSSSSYEISEKAIQAVLNYKP